jgi:hypothetical protein
MRLLEPYFNKIGKPCIFAIVFALLGAGCLRSSGNHPSDVPQGQGTPTSDIQTIPNKALRSNDVQRQSDTERIAQEFIDTGGQFTSSPASCNEILKVEPWCGVITSAVQVSSPEWEELFPTTDFYIVRRVLYGGEIPFQRNLLVVEQDGNKYGVESYQRLLDLNNVEVSSENREIIAKSIVLMMLPDFIEYEVRFATWEEGDWPSRIRANYNYSLTLWTQLGGYEMRWLFLFYEGELLTALGWVVDEGIGDYVAIPREGPRPPSPEDFEYWNK